MKFVCFRSNNKLSTIDLVTLQLLDVSHLLLPLLKHLLERLRALVVLLASRRGIGARRQPDAGEGRGRPGEVRDYIGVSLPLDEASSRVPLARLFLVILLLVVAAQHATPPFLVEHGLAPRPAALSEFVLQHHEALLV